MPKPTLAAPLALALICAAAPAARAQERTAVCANEPIDRLPAGTVFGVSQSFLEKAKQEISRERSEMERSPYQTHPFSVIFDSRISWMDGSQVSVTCTLRATLHQVEGRRFSILGVAVKQMPRVTTRDGKAISPEWTKYVYELDDGEIRFPASLTCETAPEHAGKDYPYAPIERTRISIGALESLLFERLPLAITSKTGC